MDIKDLNKSQLILLAVLLSFVTSIATGITTVTLMQQAPTSFTAPVNRIIQQTVEKIQQLEGKTVEVSSGRGFAVSVDGITVVDGNLVPDKGVYYLKNDSGKFKADFVLLDKAGFSFLKAGAPLDEKNKLTFTIPTLGDLEKMKMGQKILVLGSSISSFIFEGNKDIKITVTKSNAGGLVLNLDGEVLGIALSSDTTSFASIKSITDALKGADTTTPKTP